MRIEDVSAGYGENIIVGGVNLEIKKGEIISLIGPNGGGKSTVLKSISSQLKPIKGSVFLGKTNMKDISTRELSREMSIVTTERVKPQHMTCRDVVLAGRLPFTDGFGFFKNEDREIADKTIKLLKIEKIADKQFSALSDGQKQRTLIARAICQSPQYLVMDERTSYLDIRYRMPLMDVIKELCKKGVTVIMSLHELELALSVSDRLLLISDGGSCKCETPKEVMNKDLIKDLFKLTDEMYEKVKTQMSSQMEYSDNCRHSTYFLNKKCEYYPCHDLPEERFSCMFCYCPLYDMEDCGGNYTFTEKGAKNCKDCTFPHDRANYPKVLKKLKEKMYGNSANRKI